MSIAANVELRPASAADSPSIAKLHADSWRRHYRGAYSDRYLDGDLDADRLATWTARLTKEGEHFTLLAEHRHHPIGFIHVALDADPTWGALIDNLHVAHAGQRNGIGTLLLDRAARMIIARRPGSGVYLWVLEQNASAQAFYLSRGGALRERALATPPAGDPRNLDGEPVKIRVAWPDPASLMDRRA